MLSIYGGTGVTAYFGLLEIGRAAAGRDRRGVRRRRWRRFGRGPAREDQGRRPRRRDRGHRREVPVGRRGPRLRRVHQLQDRRRRRSASASRAPTASTCSSTTSAARSSTRCSARSTCSARIVMCGAISEYNRAERHRAQELHASCIMQRGRMEGFIILDYVDRFLEAIMELAAVGGRGSHQVRGRGGGRARRTRPTRSTGSSPATTPAS